MTRHEFDSMIGQLDRMLSLLLWTAETQNLDDADKQTMKHHAEDMIGAGKKILGVLKNGKDSNA